MTNTQFNSEVLNKDNLLLSQTKGQVEFNNFNLTSLCGNKTGIIITDENFFDNGNIDIGSFVFSQIDGGGVFSKKYGNKEIQIKLFIQGESFSDLISRIDELKKNTQGIEAEFDILVNGEYRTYIATCNSITLPNLSASQDFVDEVEMNFTITNGNWYTKKSEYTFYSNQVGNLEAIINNLGTHSSFPKIVLLCKNSGNTITNIEIIIKQIGDITGYPISINTPVSNNDIVIFDYMQKIVTINDEEINFFGPMTPFEIGFNVVDINITGESNYDAYILYNKVYL